MGCIVVISGIGFICRGSFKGSFRLILSSIIWHK